MDDKIKQSILGVLILRAPNAVRLEIIVQDSKEFNVNDVERVLNSLVEANIVTVNPKGLNKSYKLASYENIPSRKSIPIAGIDFPRMMDGDIARAEDINIVIEAIADYAKSLEGKFEEILNKRIRSYWADTITLFGIFIALFSFIVSSAGKVTIDPAWNWTDIFMKNLAQVAPLAIVLGAFIILVKLLFR